MIHHITAKLWYLLPCEMSKESVDYERIYLNQSRNYGRTRIADSGLGWKPSTTAGGSAEKTFLLAADQIVASYWSRGSRGFEVRIYTKNNGVVSLDGFDQNDFNSLKNTISKYFNNVQLEHREHSLRGWNWGKTDLARDELVFNINNRPDFEIPYNEISNSNLTGKNEVAIELALPDLGAKAGDELVEVRLYIPGTVEYNDEDVPEEDKEEKTLASVFYEQLKEKASIGQVSGEAIVTFSDILFLTPRGRYDIEMYSSSLRLRGKTYDYKIQYKQIERIFSLPKLDDIHHLMIIQIDPPLRQGQTRYPFLVMQFRREEEMEVELNVDDEEFELKYKDKLSKSYDDQTHKVMSQCFRGLSSTKIVTPGSFTSKYNQPGFSCSWKASEGHLYPLERGLLFVTKPTVYIPFSDIQNITMSRAGTSTTSRTFDMEINSRGSGGSHTFGNINKEEQESIELYCKAHSIVVKNDEKEVQKLVAAAMGDDSDDSDVDIRGSADEDESVDEDFNDESDSDVAEEFDSDADSDSDLEMGEDDEPPTKKAKK